MLSALSTPGTEGAKTMTTSLQDQLLSRLMTEWRYGEEEAQSVAAELEHCAPEVLAAFHIWWETGTLGIFEVQGYTVAHLMEEYQMNPIAAFLTLDWLWKEPDVALGALAEGYDIIK
jgi:hypothetical protein